MGQSEELAAESAKSDRLLGLAAGSRRNFRCNPSLAVQRSPTEAQNHTVPIALPDTIRPAYLRGLITRPEGIQDIPLLFPPSAKSMSTRIASGGLCKLP